MHKCHNITTKILRSPATQRILFRKRMKPPQEPKAEDCCNSGCNPCIFEVYEQQLKRYKKSLEENEELTEDDNIISQLEYTEFTVSALKDYCPGHKLIKFQHSTLAGKIKYNPGAHFLVKYFSENPCSRAYTPVKHIAEMSCENNEFIVIVKNCGPVSNYLCSLALKEKTVWRGPYGSFELLTHFKNMILISHGTGIATFIPIIHKLLDNDDILTRITLFYCCKKVELVLFRETLFSYQSHWNFKYKIFLSHAVNSPLKYNEPVVQHKLNYDDFEVFKPFTNDTQFLVSGSNAFKNYYKTYLLENSTEINNVEIF